MLITDGKSLFLKHRVEDKESIAEVITGNRTGQYLWAYAIGSLIEEIEQIVGNQFSHLQLVA
jgi:hypothetical protein